MFELALLVSILVSQLFAFVESQFAAALGLSIDILLLLAVRAILEHERRPRSVPDVPRAVPVPRDQPTVAAAHG